MDIWTIIAPALSGVLASVLMYLATRRQAQVLEREVYITAVGGLTSGLQAEIERLSLDRQGFMRRVEELEARVRHYEQAEGMLKQKVTELLTRIEQLEVERDRLKADLKGGGNDNNREERP